MRHAKLLVYTISVLMIVFLWQTHAIPSASAQPTLSDDGRAQAGWPIDGVGEWPGGTGATLYAKGRGKKGGGGGSGGSAPPVGRIAYSYGDSVVMIDADGGNPSTTSGLSGSGRSIASRARHGGQAYFLREEFDDPTPAYPDGQPIRDLVVYDEAGQRHPLTLLDGDMQTIGGYNWAFDGQRGLADGNVIFTARRFDPAGEVIEAGVYRLQVDFAPDGSMIGAVAGSITLVAPAPLIPFHTRGLYPDVSHLSANGDGSEIVYARISDGMLMRTAIPTAASAHAELGVSGRDAEWSPVEDLIVFAWHPHLYTVDADGGNVRRLARGRVRRNIAYGTTLGNPMFSPDGAHVVFGAAHGPYESDLDRITKDGSGQTTIAQQMTSVAGWTAP